MWKKTAFGLVCTVFATTGWIAVERIAPFGGWEWAAVSLVFGIATLAIWIWIKRGNAAPGASPEPESYEPVGAYSGQCKSLKRLENTIEDDANEVNLQDCVEIRLRLSALDISFPVVPDNSAFEEWLWASRRVRAALEFENIKNAREVWPKKHG